jgi:hypothetical protein
MQLRRRYLELALHALDTADVNARDARLGPAGDQRVGLVRRSLTRVARLLESLR